jgi:membrane dipeptidase
LNDHPRNIPDDLLKRIGTNGGVVMINFYTSFIDPRSLAAERARDQELKPQIDALNVQYKDDSKRLTEETDKLYAARPLPPTPVSILIDHIDHAVKIAGIDHVGLGSDFDGGITLPTEIRGVQDMPVITYELLKRGYSEKDVRKILGGNFMRAFAQVEHISRRMQRRGDRTLP